MQQGGAGGFLTNDCTLFKQKSNPERKRRRGICPSCPLPGTMGRSIQPNPDATRCLGRNGAGTCPFPDATCRMNKRDRNGIAMWKKMCWGCSTGKLPPAPRLAPQPRAVQPPQLNSFGGLASTISPTPVGRGHPGKRTKWSGAAREFEDETSEEAIAYRTRRNGGPTRKYHPWSEDISRQFPCLHCVRNDSRLNRDGSCVSDQYDPTHPCIGCCQCAEIVCELCRLMR